MKTEGLDSRRNIKKKSWRLRLILLGISVFIAGIALLALHIYTFFPAREVVFYGNKHLRAEELKAMMGLRGYEDLFDLSSSRLASGLLRSPWVKSASVRKEYPSRLIVKIKEAEPLAILNSAGLYLIDDEGRKLETIKGEPVTFLPVISSSGDLGPDALAGAVGLARAVRQAGVSGRQVEITGLEAGKENITANIDGTAVRMGEGRYEEKLARFLELEAEIKKRWANVDYVDLRFANRVVVRPLKEEIK